MENTDKKQAYLKELKEGDVLFYQGEEELVLYKVLSGEIALYINYGESTERELARMNKEQCFGEMAILEKKPRSATAVAAQDSILMAYPEKYMKLFITQNPTFIWNVMQGLSDKLRNATKEINEMQELILLANKSIPENKPIDRYIQMHTQFNADGIPYFAVKI